MRAVAATTAAPPPSWAAWRRSPRKTAASATAPTASKVMTTEVRLAPSWRRAANIRTNADAVARPFAVRAGQWCAGDEKPLVTTPRTRNDRAQPPATHVPVVRAFDRETSRSLASRYTANDAADPSAQAMPAALIDTRLPVA